MHDKTVGIRINKILNILINFDEDKEEKRQIHNPHKLRIPDHPYRILIAGGSASEKTNALLNLINHQPDINKIFLHVKYPYKLKHQFLINRRKRLV